MAERLDSGISQQLECLILYLKKFETAIHLKIIAETPPSTLKH